MPQADSEARRACSVTLAEAAGRGMTMPRYSTPPEAQVCGHCGEMREPHGLVHPLHGDAVVRWFAEPRACACPEAAAEAERETLAAAGRQRVEEEEAERAARERRSARLLSLSGIKPRFLTCTFSTFAADGGASARALLTSRRYAETFERRRDEGKGLYFSGGTGSGKTHLAVAVSLELLSRGIPAICTTAIDLLSDVKRAYERGRRSEHEIITGYRETELLVLDDLGKEPPTDWALSVMFGLVNDRYERLKPTVVTTQYGDGDLVRRFARNGDPHTARAIVSRLHAMCYLVETGDRDRRGEGP